MQALFLGKCLFVVQKLFFNLLTAATPSKEPPSHSNKPPPQRCEQLLCPMVAFRFQRYIERRDKEYKFWRRAPDVNQL